jgi:hypothetical protein
MRIALAIIGLAIGFIFGCGLPKPPAHPAPGVWYVLWSAGADPEMQLDVPYAIPGDGGYVAYVQTAQSGAGTPSAMALTFTVTGAANLTAAIPDKYSISDFDPPALRLFIELPGDNFTEPTKRYWCGDSKVNLTSDGEFAISCPLTFDHWADVNGVPELNQGFFDVNVLGRMQYAGFTFGGQNYAGHGVGCKKEPCTFTLDSWRFQ